MKITVTKRRALVLAASVGVLALGLAGCTRGGGTPSGDDSGAAASPGITDTTITIGIDTPLTGTTAGPGNCTADGAIAYFGGVNDAGGVKFGDGKTRKVEFKLYDDKYDPNTASSNFQQAQSDGVFAMALGLGTPTNNAWKQAALDAGVPQVLIMTGDPKFDDVSESPNAIGLVPKYQDEGEAFGKLLAADGKQHKVAIIEQNDDYGKGYVEGFKAGIGDSKNIEIVSDLTYEPTDTSLDGQVTQSAATGADVLFNAVSVTPLAVGELQKAQAIGWKPSIFAPSNTSSPGGVLTPGGAIDASGNPVYPGIYSVSFSNVPAAPTFASSENGQKFLDAIKNPAYYPAGASPQTGVPDFPHCVWSWIGGQILDQAFQKMTSPTRDAFMEALRSISGYKADFMLEGTSVDTTKDGSPAISTVVVQKFNGKGYATVQNFG